MGRAVLIYFAQDQWKREHFLNKPALISVIITSYNWSKAIEAVLFALDHQTDHQFEVLIADDGSRAEELLQIRKMVTEFNYPIRLVWQKDCGFRAAKVRNQAAAQARGDCLVFLDGDCIPRPDFIARHRKFAEAGFWLAGNRVLFSEAFTKKVLADEGLFLNHSGGYWWLQSLRGNINRCSPLLYWPLSLGRKGQMESWKGAKTCNLAVWKKDFFAVNGFDEHYEGWGYEDSDFVIRLIRSGIYRKSGKFALPVFHLWHEEQDRSLEPGNLARLQAIIANHEHRAALGVDQYDRTCHE